VWRQLGITPDVHSAVFAWVHYRQFALSQELLLLEVARQAVQAVRGGGGGGGVSSREGSPQPAANGAPQMPPHRSCSSRVRLRSAAGPGSSPGCRP
jgi:hypothetical protein